MIKNLPLDWKTCHLLNLMSQMKLPLPTSVTFLYDNFRKFRGMAFATFASSNEVRQVIQELMYHPVSGRNLNVQYRRKRQEGISSRTPFQSNHSSHTVRDNPQIHPPAKVSSSRRPIRERTPPSESYDLLMHHQTDPVEKEKLRRFLAQTGDYQEAINEFAKNRVRESDGAYPGSTGRRPILEMRPATPEELQQIAEMERRWGLGGEASSNGSLVVKNGETDTANATENGLMQSTNLALTGNKHETTFAGLGRELGEGKDGVGVETGRAEEVADKEQGLGTAVNKPR